MRLGVLWALFVASGKMFIRNRAAVFFSLFLPLIIMLIFGVLNFEGSTVDRARDRRRGTERRERDPDRRARRVRVPRHQRGGPRRRACGARGGRPRLRDRHPGRTGRRPRPGPNRASSRTPATPIRRRRRSARACSSRRSARRSSRRPVAERGEDRASPRRSSSSRSSRATSATSTSWCRASSA